MWLGIGGGRSGPAVAPFSSKLSVPAEGVVVLLGAGASACAGAPLMRGFIDRARDYTRLGLFDGQAAVDVAVAIAFYDSLRSHLRITELDIENVENLLSLAEMSEIIPNLPFSATVPPDLARSVRAFIEAVLGKAIRVPPPASPSWVGLHRPLSHKYLVAALARYGNKATVVTTNYDCILEFTCYCMGVPFTYDRRLGEGVEILKLHGSINWLSCGNGDCDEHRRIRVGSLRHAPLADATDTGTVETQPGNCERCGRVLQPYVVPPTWTKSLDHPVLRRAWSDAFERLSNAEVMASIGYSLPDADPKFRELLHVGLASARLRQATIAVGGDQEAEQRWSRMFRDSWREYRLQIRAERFEALEHLILLQALALEDSTLIDPHEQLLPFPASSAMNKDAMPRIEAALRARRPDIVARGVNWAQVAREARTGKPPHQESAALYREVLKDTGFDWTPTGPILPVHGDRIGSSP